MADPVTVAAVVGLGAWLLSRGTSAPSTGGAIAATQQAVVQLAPSAGVTGAQQAQATQAATYVAARQALHGTTVDPIALAKQALGYMKQGLTQALDPRSEFNWLINKLQQQFASAAAPGDALAMAATPDMLASGGQMHDALLGSIKNLSPADGQALMEGLSAETGATVDVLAAGLSALGLLVGGLTLYQGIAKSNAPTALAGAFAAAQGLVGMATSGMLGAAAQAAATGVVVGEVGLSAAMGAVAIPLFVLAYALPGGIGDQMQDANRMTAVIHEAQSLARNAQVGTAQVIRGSQALATYAAAAKTGTLAQWQAMVAPSIADGVTGNELQRWFDAGVQGYGAGAALAEVYGKGGRTKMGVKMPEAPLSIDELTTGYLRCLVIMLRTMDALQRLGAPMSWGGPMAFGGAYTFGYALADLVKPLVHYGGFRFTETTWTGAVESWIAANAPRFLPGQNEVFVIGTCLHFAPGAFPTSPAGLLLLTTPLARIPFSPAIGRRVKAQYDAWSTQFVFSDYPERPATPRYLGQRLDDWKWDPAATNAAKEFERYQATYQPTPQGGA